ncbi:MAG: FecR family protein [Bacteroides sp.]|uniref:FecR family protein n=1 Tax=Bacteroides sp. TaxID=29523 RepID=UPI002FC9CD33|nr:FecR family protein [Bacteroides sp.]
METEEIKYFINRFFGKRYSEQGRRLFGIWIRDGVNTSEKEKSLEDLWKESEHITHSISTAKDWSELRSKMELPVAKKRFHLPTWTKYAAILAIVFISVTVTWFAKDYVSPPDNIHMLQCFVPFDEHTELILPDGTKVWINAGSLLVYPESFDNTANRSVYLTGEAFFSVTKDPEKPFIVKTAQIDVQALGTEFTVEAYPNEDETRATLEEGSIKVDVFNKQPYMLKPSEQLVYNRKNDSISIHNIDLDHYKMCRAGYLIFEDASFDELVHGLERRYQTTIHYNSNKYIYGHYNVKFAPHETLYEALEVLKELIDLKYSIKDKAVYIK